MIEKVTNREENVLPPIEEIPANDNIPIEEELEENEETSIIKIFKIKF